ncbi:MULTISPECIES: hypothetical protein [Mesonia]|uniref:Uncharacterized protein n=1 Tax=Mesonia oceanica TaxID=2687242 RepID=A0AC61Y3N8_9FLAO|nr:MULTISPECIES: hypothetical protein [Mesonia]MAQ41488.1 hypothetical protein [Mesonia sp.]VVU99027.1 hypothetical protein FVB9532_00277 [Mesonia oceanica]
MSKKAEKQYHLKENSVILTTKKPPLFFRAFMFPMAFISFALPLLFIYNLIVNGGRFHIGYLIAAGAFGLLGFYILRVALWNSYGSEKISFFDKHIEYEADYGWFKDGKTSITNKKDNKYSVSAVGYEDDQVGVLSINGEDGQITSVVKMPINQLENLIEELKK